MSGLTQEFSAAIAEIAKDLGEGLQAKLIVPQVTVDPNTGAVTSAGADLEFAFGCPPPSPRRVGPMDGEALVDALTLVVPRILDGAGALVTPQRGNTVRLYGQDYQVILVTPIGAGDDVAGFSLAIRH